MSKSSPKLLVGLGALCAVLTAVPEARAQIENCNMTINCSITMGQNRCTLMRGFTGAPVFNNDVMNNVVSCVASVSMTTQLYYLAVANTTAPATRTCHWDVSFGAGFNNECTIDMADGLPVELMDFEVVDDAKEDGRDAPAGDESADNGADAP